MSKWIGSYLNRWTHKFLLAPTSRALLALLYILHNKKDKKEKHIKDKTLA
jgi:hypothetical protein